MVPCARRGRGLGIPVILVLVGAVVGCSDDGGEDATSGTTTSSSSSSGGSTTSSSSSSGGGGGGPPAVTTEEHAVASGDVTLHVRVTGAGDAGRVMVAINGGPGFSHHSVAAFEALASGELRVVTYDQRGTGQSTPPADDDYSLDAYVADLEAVRAFLGAEDLVLMGHSFGGIIADAYVVAHPASVAAVALVDAMPPDRTSWNQANQRAAQRVQELQAEGVLPAQLSPDYCERSFQAAPAYFAEPPAVLPDALLDTACATSTANATFSEMSAGFDFTQGLGSVTVPILVVFGESDLFGLETAQPTIDAFSSATVTYEVMPATGHFPWLEGDVAAFDAVMRTFLSGVP